MITLNDIQKKLADTGLKSTPQRLIIYDTLFGMDNHPTPEMVYELVKEKNPGISLGTVYKTLETFVSVGLAEKVMTGEGFLRFDAKTENHNHIYLTDSKEIIDFEDEGLNNLLKEYFSKNSIKNLNIKDIRIQVMGEKIDKYEPVVKLPSC